MTGRDAVVAATHALREDRELAAQLRERHRFVFVDDAQELTDAEVQLLRAIFGEALGGVTLCGDPESAISMVHRTQPGGDLCALRLARRAARTAPIAPH